jgi:hypothetical protein
MVLDNEEQRQIILHALVSQPMQGDYEGIVQYLAKYTHVVEAVKAATIGGADADKPTE